MIPLILQYAASQGHAVFTDGNYNLNIIGLRKPNGKADTFDDLMTVTYRDENGTWVTKSWPITTDPGLHYMMSKSKQLNPAGTAILKEGQYRSTYGFGLHGSSKYEALTQQHGVVKVHRDGNLDAVHDYSPNVQEGWFGINIHASTSSPYEGDETKARVGVWSAGCQVFQNESDFREFMGLCKKQVAVHPTWTKFTYTLIQAPEIW